MRTFVFWISFSTFVFTAVLPLSWGASAPESPAVRAVLNREYLPAVLEMIRSAKKSLCLIQYEYISHGAVRQIEQALLDADRRGVKIHILVDDTVRASRKNVAWLAKKGIDIKLDETQDYGESGDKTTHAKMILVDDQKFIVGSTNFSDKSISDNNEANLTVAHAAAAKRLRGYFDQLWKDATGEPAIEAFRSPSADVIFNRQYLPAVKQLFHTAQKRIYVVLYGANIGRPGSAVRELVDELKAAKKRGVDVRVILDKSGGQFAEKTLGLSEAAAAHMEAAGIAVKFESEEVITHAKVLVVDDAAVVGGTNWGSGPLEHYNDINVIVRLPDVVGKLSTGFLKLWSGVPRF